MDQSLENRIRERAYEMWTAHGCVDGQAEQHWLAAEREVLATSMAVVAGKTNPKKKPRPSAGSKTPRTRIAPEMPIPLAIAARGARTAGHLTAAYSSGSGSLTTGG